MTTEMKTMLARIAYPARGTADETADISTFAAEIQQRWSLEYLQGDTDLPSVENELRTWPDKFRAEAAELRKAQTPKATGGAIVYEDIAAAIGQLLKPNKELTDNG